MISDLLDAINPLDWVGGLAIPWLIGTWVVSVVLLRFGPRQCPKLTTVTIDDGWAPDGRRKTRTEVQRYSNHDCTEALHFHHVILRDYAVLIGVLWPVLLVLSPVIGAAALYSLSIAHLGSAKWVERERDEKIDLMKRYETQQKQLEA